MFHGLHPGGPGPRAELLARQREDLARPSFFQKFRAGLLLSAVMVVAALGALFVGFGWQSYRDPYSETSHSVTLTFYGAGLVMCAVGIIVPILMAWRGVRWARGYRSTVVRDRGVAARRLDGPVPVELATLWDVRRPGDLVSVIGPALPGILRAPQVPHSRFRGGLPALVIALMTCIVGLINLWDPVDDPVQHAPGTMLASILALAAGIVSMVVWSILYISLDNACNLRDVHIVECVAYGRALPGGEAATGIGGSSRPSLTPGSIVIVVVLLGIAVVRILADPLAFVVAMAIVAVFVGSVCVVRISRRHHPRTLPLMAWDQKGPAPLQCEPACRVVMSAQPGSLRITDPRGSRPEIVLDARDIVDVVEPKRVTATVVVVGRDDILLVLTGKDAPRQIQEWWARNRAPGMPVGPAE